MLLGIRLDYIRTYGLVTQPIDIFSGDPQWNLLKTAGNAYLAAKLRTVEYILLPFVWG